MAESGKQGDFAGLPEDFFVLMMGAIQSPSNPLKLRAGNDLALLAAIAKAEHAGAKSVASPNVADYVFACLDVRDAFILLQTNGDDSLGKFLGGLQAALTKLQNLFP